MSMTETDLELEGIHATLAAAQIDLVAGKVESNRDRLLANAASVMTEASRSRGSTFLNEDEFRGFKQAVETAARYDGLLTTLEKLKTEQRSRAAVIGYEPRVYGHANPDNSFFLDLAWSTQPGHQQWHDATARLDRHAHEVAVEMRRGSSPEGRRAKKTIREHYRSANVPESRRLIRETETRAMSSAPGSGGPFVTPQYVVDQFALYRTPARAFADQAHGLKLPPYGLEVYLPAMTGPAAAGPQTEGSGVDETDPTSTYLSSSLETIAGQVTISQQLYDRGGCDGLSTDQIIGLQVKEQIDQQIDAYVLTQALANAGSVTDSGTASIATLYADTAAARQLLADTAGTRLLATHLFTTSDLFGWATSLLDDQHRPILTPDSGALVAAAAMGDPQWQSWTGVHLGQLRWHTDDNIPATGYSGLDTQLVVARPAEVFVWESDEPIAFAYPQTEAAALEVIIGLRSYVGCIVRYPKAVASISGDAYSTSLA